jgi:hypothetical protein
VRTTVVEYANALRSAVGKTAPYLLVELLLPGGTLIALLLFLHQRRRKGAANAAHTGVIERWLETTEDRVSLALPTWRLASRAAANDERDGLEPLAMVPRW